MSSFISLIDFLLCIVMLHNTVVVLCLSFGRRAFTVGLLLFCTILILTFIFPILFVIGSRYRQPPYSSDAEGSTPKPTISLFASSTLRLSRNSAAVGIRLRRPTLPPASHQMPLWGRS